jgi:hypothetical protein|tara:strand:+ start:4743 stop:5345 length:603 start_codon:yes stop_codon:yes gene_type:complete
MKKILKLLAFASIIISLNSCAIHTGYMNNSTSLNQANFKYVKSGIMGTASTTKVLGIGGLTRSAIVEEAKRNMLQNAPLKSNQAIANTTVNWKNGFYFIINIRECTVTADIVEFYSEYNTDIEKTETTPSDIESTTLIKNKVVSKSLYTVGDKMWYTGGFKKVDATILKTEGQYYIIEYLNKKGIKKTRRVDEIWLKKNE